MKEHKKLWIAAATVTLTASIAMGTFAWQSVSQRMINEKVADKNPGGRIHDDFNGETKAVYAENFTTKEDGVAIYVRIRLDEYMETGEDAGINREAEHRNVKVLGKYQGEDADINDSSTWRTHKPDTDGDEDPFHDYWSWNMGGSTIYMPTFNKNKDSLAVDSNGTYAGKDGIFSEGTPYDDYYPYVNGEKKPSTAYYDYDTDNDYDEGEGIGLGNGGTSGINYREENEEHTAAYTSNASIKKMSDWIRTGCIPGNYWVWDDDGWYYWALPLNPEETTGCLLNSISQIQYGEKTYYAIEVVGQFATAGDWGDPTDGTGFYADGNEISDNAKILLETIQKLVTGEDGAFYVAYGSNVYQRVEENGVLSEYICAGKDMKIGSKDDKIGVIVSEIELEIDGVNYGTLFLKSSDSNMIYYAVGSDGNLGTEDDLKLWYTGTEAFPKDKDAISTKGAESVTVTSVGDVTMLQPSESLTLTASVWLNSVKISNQKVTWNMTGNQSESTYINAQGILYIGEDELAGSALNITAVSEEDNRARGTYLVTVEGPERIDLTLVTGTALGEQGQNLKLSAVVKKGNADYAVQKVQWKVEHAADSKTSVNEQGQLSIGSDETRGNVLKVTATSVNDGSVFETLEIKVAPYATLSNGIIEIDGIEFYKMAKKTENGKELTLLLCKDVLESTDGEIAMNPNVDINMWSTYYTFGTNNLWRDSYIRAYLNNKWISKYPMLNKMVVQTTIYTASSATAQNDPIETQDKVFLLSEADLNGTQNQSAVMNEKLYTAGAQLSPMQFGTPSTWRVYGNMKGGEDTGWYWVRSPFGTGSATYGCADNKCSQTVCTWYSSIRPAVWVNFAD